MKKILLIFAGLLMVGGNLLLAQKVQVSGVVSSEGMPFPFVTVAVKGTTQGVQTDNNGRYTLSVASDATLVFSFIGYQTQEIPVNGRTTINVTLLSDVEQLDDVMVVAYGTAKKDSYVGSAGVVSAKKLETRTVANVTKAIDGIVPGVQATTGSGQPGSGATIRVRGFGSINSSNDPLYVVDGAPYDGAISAINPDDIASMTILKDASASALYGARGANGVILITTKRGSDQEGKARVSLKATWGFAGRAVPRYDLLDEKGFLESTFEMYKNLAMYKNGIPGSQAGQAALTNMVTGANRIFGVNEQYNPYNMPVSQLIDINTGKVNPNAQLRYHQDWMDEATADNPFRQEYVATVAGGSAKTRYYASIGYLNEEGLLATTSFERFTGRLNLDTQVNDWLKFGGSMNASFNTTNSNDATGTSTSNVWYSAQGMAPIYPVYEVDPLGNIIYQDGKAKYDYGVNRPSGASPNFNSVALLFDDHYFQNSDNLNVRAYTEIALDKDKYGWAKGLSFKVDFNATDYNARATTYYNPLYGNAGGDTKGRLTKSANRIFSFTFNQILSYNRTFGDHTIEALAGHEYYSLKTNSLSAQKTGFPFPDIFELNPGATITDVGSLENNYRIESFLARAKYSYANKYNFEASFRTDGSSRFHPDHRWGIFWSVGANWKISNEAFLKNVQWLNNLSLRASYGVQGNDMLLSSAGSPVYYAWQSFYYIGENNANNNGSVLNSLENKDITWEKNANFNVGLDARLFDRVSLSADFFRRNTTDMLLAIPMATSLGFDSYNGNVGEMYNQGIEFSVGIDVIKSENFEWRLNLVGSAIKNRITKLASETPIIGGSMIYKVGEPIYSWYLPQSAGIDPATGKQLYYVWDKVDPDTNERDPNSPIYISDDPAKASNSRVTAGNKMPDFYGSIGSEFQILKDFDFSFLTTYSIGGKTLDGQYNTFMEPLYPGNTMHKNVQRAWKNPGDITDIPRLEMNSGNRSTTAHLLDASFFAIRNITLGYTLPKVWLDSVGIGSARVFVSADNLITFSRLNGFDPQQSLTSTTDYTYVPVRTISFGVNLNF